MGNALSLQVLLVDDDVNIRRTLGLSLKELNCGVVQAASVDEAISRVQTHTFDLILTDYKMERQNGLDLIKRVKALHPEQLIVVMTAFASFENAVEVVKEGAFDYLPKPFTTAHLSHLLTRVRELVALRWENLELRRSKARRHSFSGFTSPASQRLEEFVRKLAANEGTVLLSGESGTGKSELAKLVHELSPRASKSFVTVYCTTLTESLLESELFGHVKGAFTGAIADKVGKLELADGGTLFLDEVGDLTPNGQMKLLRFLQDRVFERIGSNREVTVDARVIAATHRNLAEAVAAGKFREDLFYRLNIFECILVPLRHRREDLPILIDRLVKELGQGKSVSPAFPAPVMDILLKYHWPGNIRELRNVLERVLMLSAGRTPAENDLPESLMQSLREAAHDRSGPGGENRELMKLEQVEREHIQTVLAHAESLERAAEILGITTVTLWRKRKEYGLP